jgi:phage shock protein A
MGLLDRIGRVIRAQINSLGNEAQDPEKLLEEMTAQMELELIEMRRALAEAIATHKSMERQKSSHQLNAQKWYERAQLAIDKGNEALAKEALVNRQSYLGNAQGIENHLAEHSQVIQRVKQELQTLERKYGEVRAKKSLYLARLRSAVATQKLQEIVGNWNDGSATSVFERMESKILELESENELLTQYRDPLEQQLNALEGDRVIQSELEQLKANRRNLPPTSP